MSSCRILVLVIDISLIRTGIRGKLAACPIKSDHELLGNPSGSGINMIRSDRLLSKESGCQTGVPTMYKYARTVTLSLVMLTCGACAAPRPTSISLPVAVVSKAFPGGILRGTLTATTTGSSFSVSNGTLSCGGSYDAFDVSPTISVPVLCSDGRKGIVIAMRENGGMNGGGHFTLSDGSTGDFIFGAEAAKL